MSKFIEGRLEFIFDDAKWPVQIKYDDTPSYRRMNRQLRETKAVDFIVGDAKERLFFIEIKDFRGYRIENKQRISSGELANEVALKVRDSLAGVIGAHRNPSVPDEWKDIVSSLTNRAKDVKVVLWLEEDGDRGSKKGTTDASMVAKVLKEKLGWLTSRVMVVSQRDVGLIPGISVRNLPHGE
jgi:hypothetical protein